MCEHFCLWVYFIPVVMVLPDVYFYIISCFAGLYLSWPCDTFFWPSLSFVSYFKLLSAHCQPRFQLFQISTWNIHTEHTVSVECKLSKGTCSLFLSLFLHLHSYFRVWTDLSFILSATVQLCIFAGCYLLCLLPINLNPSTSPAQHTF